MSQETPRNIYGNRNDRSSVDSYGFPSTHSTSSSISSSGNFSSYYGDSVSDYSTAGSDIESVGSRTLPRPQGMLSTSLPPAPQSMMGQFSSKVSSSTQKKHKCKVCEKRFTRPSSLQTHMYSHTGEKRKYSITQFAVVKDLKLIILISIRLRSRGLWTPLLCCLQPATSPKSPQGRCSIRGWFRRPPLGLKHPCEFPFGCINRHRYELRPCMANPFNIFIFQPTHHCILIICSSIEDA